MSTREQIINFIEQEHNRLGFTPSFDYQLTLGFKLSNTDNKTSESFSVSSLDEAEDVVISFISTVTKGEIFTNDIFDESKNLFLRVKVILPA
uniref:hypothetical protein n=1 Tax=Flavobacterium sp. TaxID=239 RepID=UPI00404AD692